MPHKLGASEKNSFNLFIAMTMQQNKVNISLRGNFGGHGGTELTHSPPTSKVDSSNLGPYMGKLVVAY